MEQKQTPDPLDLPKELRDKLCEGTMEERMEKIRKHLPAFILATVVSSLGFRRLLRDCKEKGYEIDKSFTDGNVPEEMADHAVTMGSSFFAMLECDKDEAMKELYRSMMLCKAAHSLFEQFGKFKNNTQEAK